MLKVLLLTLLLLPLLVLLLQPCLVLTCAIKQDPKMQSKDPKVHLLEHKFGVAHSDCTRVIRLPSNPFTSLLIDSNSPSQHAYVCSVVAAALLWARTRAGAHMQQQHGAQLSSPQAEAEVRLKWLFLPSVHRS
jgi:hypothetical protein